MEKWLEGRVAELKRWSKRLYSLKIDGPDLPFKAGQFARLALKIDGQLVARPYSFVNAPTERPHEFYFILLDNGPLTSAMVKLNRGDSISIAARTAGFLTLSEVPKAEHLWLLSTGTAIGPFLSILKTDEPWLRFTRVVLVHAVRYREELTYRDQIGRIEAAHSNQLRMVSFVSREDTDFAIKARVPQAILDGRLQARTQIDINATQSQVMICGNPDMVRDTSAVLESRGLKKNRRKDPGQITVEAYW